MVVIELGAGEAMPTIRRVAWGDGDPNQPT